MSFVNWINPHAIEITPENLDTILYRIPITNSALMELLEESRTDAMPYYIVAHRKNKDGLVMWDAYTQVQLSIEYNITDFTNRFKKKFEMI